MISITRQYKCIFLKHLTIYIDQSGVQLRAGGAGLIKRGMLFHYVGAATAKARPPWAEVYISATRSPKSGDLSNLEME